MSLRRFALPLGLLLGATAMAWSCGDPSPVGIDPRTSSVVASRGSPEPGDQDGDDGDENDDSLVSCRPLRYQSVTKRFGPEGGLLEVRHNWLVIPRGALRDTVTITAVTPSDTVALIRFQPEGLRFQKTTFLVAVYDHCRVKHGVTPRIAHVTDALKVIEFLPSVAALKNDPRLKRLHDLRHRVVGELQHFSNYAVAF